MSREVRGRVQTSKPHPTLCGAHTVTITIPASAAEEVRAGGAVTLVVPEGDVTSTGN